MLSKKSKTVIENRSLCLRYKYSLHRFKVRLYTFKCNIHIFHQIRCVLLYLDYGTDKSLVVRFSQTILLSRVFTFIRPYNFSDSILQLENDVLSFKLHRDLVHKS